MIDFIAKSIIVSDQATGLPVGVLRQSLSFRTKYRFLVREVINIQKGNV